MERKFTAEEAEIIKSNAGNIIEMKRKIDVLFELINDMDKRMKEHENCLRGIIFGRDRENTHNSLYVSPKNYILFSHQNEGVCYKLYIDTLNIEK